MNESHYSSRDNYGTAIAELNELTSLCRSEPPAPSHQTSHLINVYSEHGAYGSRLTGAGFGGCTVSLVDETKADAFIQAIRDAYYGKSNSRVRSCEVYEVVYIIVCIEYLRPLSVLIDCLLSQRAAAHVAIQVSQPGTGAAIITV